MSPPEVSEAPVVALKLPAEFVVNVVPAPTVE